MSGRGRGRGFGGGQAHLSGSPEPRAAYIAAYEAAVAQARGGMGPPCEWRPVFLFWLEQLRAEGAARGTKTEMVYRKAIRSMEQHKGAIPTLAAAKDIKVGRGQKGEEGAGGGKSGEERCVSVGVCVCMEREKKETEETFLFSLSLFSSPFYPSPSLSFSSPCDSPAAFCRSSAASPPPLRPPPPGLGCTRLHALLVRPCPTVFSSAPLPHPLPSRAAPVSPDTHTALPCNGRRRAFRAAHGRFRQRMCGRAPPSPPCAAPPALVLACFRLPLLCG